MDYLADISIRLGDALKQKNKTALAALRTLKSELIIIQTSGKGKLDELRFVKCVKKIIKQNNESKEQFIMAKRENEAQREQDQIDFLSQFLPPMLSEKEIKEKLKQICLEKGITSQADFGKGMGIASKQLEGKADGKEVAKYLKEILKGA